MPTAEKADVGRPGTWPDEYWAVVVTVLFFSVAALGIAYHEMWRDEWQAWLLARDSASVLEMLGHQRIEGHLPAWALILFVLSRFTRDPVAMQAVHLVLATTSIYLLCRFAPLPWLYKVLLAFGYFLAYEYAVIARPYALGVLALFAFCSLFPVRHRHPVPLFLSLLLLAITSVYGAIMSVAAAGMLLVEWVAGSGQRRGAWPRGKVWAGVTAWLVALTVVTIAVRPAAGFPEIITVDKVSLWSLATSISMLNRAYLPLPDLSAELMWNTHVIPRAHTRGPLALSLALALSIGISAALLFVRKPAVLFLYIAGTGGLLAFHELVHPGHMRHHGHLFLVFVACLWLSALPMHEWRPATWLDRWKGSSAPIGAAFVTGILLVHVAAAGLLYRADIRARFTSAPAVADFIESRGLEHLPIAASPAPAASSVAGYLDRPIHYLALGEPGTFVPYGRYARHRDWNVSMRLIRPFLEREDGDVIVLLRRPFDNWDPDLAVEELARFPAGIERSEEYVIYRVGPRPDPEP